jgi:hypothetical protein
METRSVLDTLSETQKAVLTGIAKDKKGRLRGEAHYKTIRALKSKKLVVEVDIPGPCPTCSGTGKLPYIYLQATALGQKTVRAMQIVKRGLRLVS